MRAGSSGGPFEKSSVRLQIIHLDEDSCPVFALLCHWALLGSPSPSPHRGFILAKVKSNFDWQWVAALVLVSVSLVGIAYFMFARP